MARIRQQHPNAYNSSGRISTEFENVVRYLNAAELGDKTVGELLAQLFDEDGVFDGPIEMRLDAELGLQYRIGTYTDPDEGWKDLASTASLRGPSGSNVGTIEGPFFYNRQDLVATAAQTVFSYGQDASVEDIVVYVNGVLQKSSGVYTRDATADTVTFASGRNLNDVITIYSVRAQSVTNYRRSDTLSTAGQAVFAFVHTSDEKLLVHRNGILQREGGSYDYTSNADTDTVTFTTGLNLNDVVSIMTVENQALQNVAGLMLEDEYTNGAGSINYAKIAIANDQIPQAKVSGLSTGLAAKAKITISSSTPVSPASGNLWLDTSAVPNVLKFYDGTQWLLTSPASTLPNFVASNALQVVRVNASGTALEFAAPDYSALVPKTYMGAANGVASLDSSGLVATAQLPPIWAASSLPYYNAGSVSNATVFVTRLFKATTRIDGITAKLAAGTCTIQLSVDGVAAGPAVACSTTAANVTFGAAVEIDSETAGKRIELVISSAAGTPSGLEVGISAVSVSA